MSLILRRGEIKTGIVICKVENGFLIDAGFKCEGFLPMKEYTNSSLIEASEEPKPGDTIEVEVVSFFRDDDDEPMILLKCCKHEYDKRLAKLEETKAKRQKNFDGKVRMKAWVKICPNCKRKNKGHREDCRYCHESLRGVKKVQDIDIPEENFAKTAENLTACSRGKDCGNVTEKEIKMSLSFNEAANEAKSILEKALSTGVEMLITPNKTPEEIVAEAQRIYNLVINSITDCKKYNGTIMTMTEVWAQFEEGYEYDDDDTISKPAQQVSASYRGGIELIKKIEKDYEVNQIRARKKYNGQIMTFTGILAELGNYDDDDDYDTIEIYLGLGKYNEDYITQSQNEYENYEGAIYCSFDRSYEDKLADLDVGSTLTVTGKWSCKGKNYMGNLDDCQFGNVYDENKYGEDGYYYN